MQIKGILIFWEGRRGGDLHTEERLFSGITIKGSVGIYCIKPNFLGCSICIAKLGIRIVYSTVARCIWKVPISQRRV